MKRQSARNLCRTWNVSAAHALYHHEGHWFHHLKRFPGALMDPEGYVLFANETEYKAHPALQHREDLHVPEGIKRIATYVHAAAQSKRQRRVTAAQYMLAYDVGRRLAAGTMTITAGTKECSSTNLKENTAADLIYNVGHLLRGETYKRAMSVETTNAYLNWIRRDYGESALQNALAALAGHIDYLEATYKIRVLGMRELFTQFSAESAERNSDFELAEEAATGGTHREGRTKTVEINIYERSAKARRECIKIHGRICVVCSFDFEREFGAIGTGYIHVHHLKDLATIGEEYEVHPQHDLRPVCPNCHAMLHRRMPAFTIEELKLHLTRMQKTLP